MGIEAITEKIAVEAAEYAGNLIAEAEAEAKKIIAAAELEAGGIRERMHELRLKDAADLKHRRHSAAELESRKLLLAAKQQMMTRAVNAAIDRIAAMDRKEYVAFLVASIAHTGQKEGELILNELDRKTIGKKLVKAANEQPGGGSLTLSEETMSAKGGYILKRGAMEINSTLETMAASVREKAAPKVIRTLAMRHNE